MLAAVNLVEGRRSEVLFGTCGADHNRQQAVVFAVLDALNRRLSQYPLQDEATERVFAYDSGKTCGDSPAGQNDQCCCHGASALYEKITEFALCIGRGISINRTEIVQGALSQARYGSVPAGTLVWWVRRGCIQRTHEALLFRLVVGIIETAWFPGTEMPFLFESTSSLSSIMCRAPSS